VQKLFDQFRFHIFEMATMAWLAPDVISLSMRYNQRGGSGGRELPMPVTTVSLRRQNQTSKL
jgi:hypothetical protein